MTMKCQITEHACTNKNKLNIDFIIKYSRTKGKPKQNIIKISHYYWKPLRKMRYFANVSSCYGHLSTKFFQENYTFSTKGSRLSTVIGTNRWFLAKSTYLSRFLLAASSSALPADCEVTEMYDIIVMSDLVSSQTAHLLSFQK